MSALFEPLQLRNITFKNRIFVSPMCTYSCEDGLPWAWHTVHLGARAVGGAAMVMTEATAVVPEGRISPADAGIWNDAQVAAWRPIVQFIKQQGAIAGIQLAHAGRKASTRSPWDGDGAVAPQDGGWQVVGPTATPFAPHYPVPRGLSVDELDKLTNDFVQAARRARDAGFDVVEVHGAHGYLLASFLAAQTNTRTDTYGGASWENRARWPLEVAAAVRDTWPKELPVFVRLSVTNWLDKATDVRENVALAQEMKQRGIDLIDCSSGGLVPKAAIALGAGYQVPLATALKRGANMPTGAVGQIRDPFQAEQIIHNADADAVLLARASLRDPNWPLHAAEALGVHVTWPKQYTAVSPRR